MKKAKTVRVHCGWEAKVKLQADKPWVSLPKIFENRALAEVYVKRHYPEAVKIHIEGVRVDFTPLPGFTKGGGDDSRRE